MKAHVLRGALHDHLFFLFNTLRCVICFHVSQVNTVFIFIKKKKPVKHKQVQLMMCHRFALWESVAPGIVANHVKGTETPI